MGLQSGLNRALKRYLGVAYNRFVGSGPEARGPPGLPPKASAGLEAGSRGPPEPLAIQRKKPRSQAVSD
jgi:hypothetical protein